MKGILTTGTILMMMVGGCAQPDARVHSRRCQTEACIKAKKDILYKRNQPDTPTATPTPVVLPAEPKELTDTIVADRLYFQSRSVITLRPKDNVLSGSDEYSLVNATSKKTLISRQAVSSTLGLTDSDRPFRLAGATDGLALQLFPAVGDDDQFQYGSNSLRLWINSAQEQKFSLIEIWLHDFDIMDRTIATISTDGDTPTGLEGWVNTVNNPVVKGDQSILTVEFSNIVND